MQTRGLTPACIVTRLRSRVRLGCDAYGEAPVKRLIESWLFIAFAGVFLPIALAAPARAGTTTPAPTTAPVLTATSSDGRVVLAWTAVSGRGYRLLKATAGVWAASPLTTTTSLTFTNSGLTNGTTFSYKVAAYNPGGAGPASNEVSLTPLAAPAGLTPMAGDQQVALSCGRPRRGR
jgi:hypothetical protein